MRPLSAFKLKMMAKPILMVDGGRVSPDRLISRPVSAVLRQKEGLHFHFFFSVSAKDKNLAYPTDKSLILNLI